MRTFADVKRRIVPGVILECVENTKRPELNGTMRRVQTVQSNAFTWLAQSLWGAETVYRRDLSWSYFPQAKMVEIIDADTFRMPITSTDPVQTVTLRFREGAPT